MFLSSLCNVAEGACASNLSPQLSSTVLAMCDHNHIPVITIVHLISDRSLATSDF